MSHAWQTQVEYEKAIIGVAEDIASELHHYGRDGATTDAVEEQIASWCESMTTYTSDCLRILLFCRDEQAYMDLDGSAEGLIKDDQVNFSILAYCAVEQDIRDRLTNFIPVSCGGMMDDDAFWNATDNTEDSDNA